jgi:hypothetical protein
MELGRGFNAMQQSLLLTPKTVLLLRCVPLHTATGQGSTTKFEETID